MPGILEGGTAETGRLSREAVVSGRLRTTFVLAVWCLCAAPDALPQAPPLDSAQTLQDLHGVSELRGLFDSDRGKIRILLLLSPT
jgi:hypothetical protein